MKNFLGGGLGINDNMIGLTILWQGFGLHPGSGLNSNFQERYFMFILHSLFYFTFINLRFHWSWYLIVFDRFLCHFSSSRVRFKSFWFNPWGCHWEFVHRCTWEHILRIPWWSRTRTCWIWRLEWWGIGRVVLFRGRWWLTLRSFELDRVLCSMSKVYGGLTLK